MLGGSDPSKSFFSWNFLSHVWEAKWAPNPDPKRPYEAILKLRHYMKLFDCIPFFTVDVVGQQVGPGYVVLNFDTWFGKGALIQTVTPIEPMLQVVTHRFYSSKSFIHPLGKLVLYGEAQQVNNK
jgi:cholesterol 7-dehydrogenase